MIQPALVMLAGLIATAPTDDPPEYEPTDRYESRQVEGWTVLVHKGFLADRPELAGRALRLLASQLEEVDRRVPPKAVEALRVVKIWLEEDEPHHPCMAYHPDAGWLRRHGMNPDKARCVEVANAGNFLSWTLEQPWMVLHELAHAYHHQVLEKGFDNAEVKLAYERAMEAGGYRAVLRSSGRTEKAYATTNPMEYFAEASEAYFGANDFYPFVRAELKKHDPAAYDLLAKLWGPGPRDRR